MDLFKILFVAFVIFTSAAQCVEIDMDTGRPKILRKKKIHKTKPNKEIHHHNSDETTESNHKKECNPKNGKLQTGYDVEEDHNVPCDENKDTTTVNPDVEVFNPNTLPAPIPNYRISSRRNSNCNSPPPNLNQLGFGYQQAPPIFLNPIFAIFFVPIFNNPISILQNYPYFAQNFVNTGYRYLYGSGNYLRYPRNPNYFAGPTNGLNYYIKPNYYSKSYENNCFVTYSVAASNYVQVCQ